MPAERTDFRFWFGSALAHGVVLGVLLASPVGQRVFRREAKSAKPQVIRRGEALAEVVDDIRDLAVMRLRGQVALLREGQTRMADDFVTMNAYYQPFVAQQLATVRARLMDDATNTFARQAVLLKATERTVREGEHGSDPMWRAYDQNRAHILAGQGEIRRALLLTAADDEGLVELQRQADEAQFEVFRNVSMSVSGQNNLWGGTKRRTQLVESLRDAEAKLADANAALPALAAEDAAARSALAEATAALASARQANPRDDKRVRQASDACRAAERRAADAKGRRSKLERDRAQWEDRRTKALAERQRLLDRVLEFTDLRDRNAQAALDAQARAVALQRDVYDRLLSRLETAADDAARSHAGNGPTTGTHTPVAEERR